MSDQGPPRQHSAWRPTIDRLLNEQPERDRSTPTASTTSQQAAPTAPTSGPPSSRPPSSRPPPLSLAIPPPPEPPQATGHPEIVAALVAVEQEIARVRPQWKTLDLINSDVYDRIETIKELISEHLSGNRRALKFYNDGLDEIDDLYELMLQSQDSYLVHMNSLLVVLERLKCDGGRAGGGGPVGTGGGSRAR